RKSLTISASCIFSSLSPRYTPQRFSDRLLATTWYYKKLKLVLGHQTIGPISGEEFLAVYSSGKLFDDSQVMSPELTDGNWVELQRLNLIVLKNRIEQRLS